MPHKRGHAGPDKKKKRGRGRAYAPGASRGVLAQQFRDRPVAAAPEWDVPFDTLEFGKGKGATEELLARAVAHTLGRKHYDTAKAIMEYGFKEDLTKEERAAIRKWSLSGASYSDMPPGALTVELPAGFMPGIGDLQAFRDVYKDLKNAETSGWTLVDLASTIPGMIGGAGFLVGLAKNADAFEGMGELWKAAEQVRKLDPDTSPDELIDMIVAQGYTEKQARQVLSIGPEGPGDFIGGKPDEVIGGTGPRVAPTTPREGERVTGVTLKDGDNIYVGEPGEIHADIAERNGIRLTQHGVERGFQTDKRPHVSPEDAQDVMEASGQTDVRLSTGRAVSEQFHKSEGLPVSGMAEKLLTDSPKIGEPTVRPPTSKTPDVPAGFYEKPKELPPGVKRVKEGAEPPHHEFLRMSDYELDYYNKTNPDAEPITRERMLQIEEEMVARDLPAPEAPEAPAPAIGTVRASGRGSEALQRAYAPELEVTDLHNEIARQMNEEGFAGGTWTTEGKEPPKKERYFVAPSKETETIMEAGPVTGEDIAAFEAAHKAEFEAGGYFGAWTTDDGNLVLDVSRGFGKKKDAMAVAANGDQMAIADRKAIAKGDWDNAFPENPYYSAEAGKSVFPDEIARMDARATALKAIPHWGEAADIAMLQHMDPAFREQFLAGNKGFQKRIRNAFRKSLEPEDMAAMIALGQQTVGWYDGAARAIQQAFKDDAYQFTALLAATSPNVPVPSNTRFALDLWDEWVRAGRPRDPEHINTLFNMVRGGEGTSGIGEHQVVTNAINNIEEVLSHPEPFEYYSDPKVWREGGVLSGLKVDPFFSNVAGDLARYTHDTHMLKYSPSHASSASRRAGMSAAIGAGGAKLAEDLALPAEVMQMANAQEAAWEPMRQLWEMAARGRGQSIEEMLFLPSGELNMETLAELTQRMEGSEDFALLLQTPEAKEMITRAGGNPEIDVPHRAGLGPKAQEAWDYALQRPESLRRAAQRADLYGEGRYMYGVGGAAAGGLTGEAMRQGGLLSQPEEPDTPPLLKRGLLFGE